MTDHLSQSVWSETGDPLADMKRWSAALKAMPKPISYIVLDPSWEGEHEDAEDGSGRRYLLCSSAILDEMRHGKHDPNDVVGNLAAISVYRRQDMPEGWPNA